MHDANTTPDLGSVTELGYLGLGVSDLGKWKDFAKEVLGLEVVDAGRNSCSFRMDYWRQRFVLTENGTDDLDFVGWRVANRDALETIQTRLERAKIPYETGSHERADERHVIGLIVLKDPTGLATEIFYGPQIEPSLPFYPGRRMHSSFVTAERGLGHFVTDIENPSLCEDFYARLLGMRGSLEFQLEVPAGASKRRISMHFMSCNSRQHSIAFANFGDKKRLSHVMTEVARLEDVGFTRDIVKRRGIPIRLDIGQHHNDRAVSFYFETPSGWNWECGWGVAAPTGQAEWGSSAIWGHEFIPPKSSETKQK